MDVKLALTGFGNVGQGLAVLLGRYGGRYAREYSVRLLLTAVADRGGAAIDPAGLDPAALLAAKEQGGTVAAHESGVHGLSVEEILDLSEANILIEAASTNFADAEPGWSYIRGALARNMDIVLASKGALALYWRALMAAAAQADRAVRFSATVGAPVPSLQVAERALIGAEIHSFEGILNGTTHQILTAMSESRSYEEGVRQAQEMGIAETDPTLDVDGWDAAAKAAIVANAVFGSHLSINDVERTGIRGVTTDEIAAAQRDGQRIKLIARAVHADGRVRATVAPERRPADDALGRLSGDDMGIVFHTSPLGIMAITVESSGESGGITTAMTVLRDVLNLARDRGWARASGPRPS